MTGSGNKEQATRMNERPDPKRPDQIPGATQKADRDTTSDRGSQTPGQGGPSAGSDSTIRSGS